MKRLEAIIQEPGKKIIYITPWGNLMDLVWQAIQAEKFGDSMKF